MKLDNKLTTNGERDLEIVNTLSVDTWLFYKVLKTACLCIINEGF